MVEYEKRLLEKISDSKKEKKAPYNPMLPTKRARGTESPQRQSPSPNRHKTTTSRTPLRISKSNSGKNSQKKSATSVKKRASASPKKGDAEMQNEEVFSGDEALYDSRTMSHAQGAQSTPLNARQTRQRYEAASKPSDEVAALGRRVANFDFLKDVKK